MAESRRDNRSVVEYRRVEDCLDTRIAALLRRAARVWNRIAHGNRLAGRSRRIVEQAGGMEGNRSRQSWLRTGRGGDADSVGGGIRGDRERRKYRAPVCREGCV